MRLAFEPEPGMFIDTFARFAELDERIRHPLFDLTVDLGHVHCIEDGPVADHVRAWGPRIANVHVEDMARGVHEHLMFGEGTMDFPPIFEALRDVDYRGGLHVELSRHSHMAVEAVRKSRDFLKRMIDVRLAERAPMPLFESSEFMAERVVLLSIPQLRRRDVTPGCLASLDAVAAKGAISEMVPPFPGLAASSFATLTTGTGPYEHGLVGNTYFDREARRVVPGPLPDSAVQAPRVWDRLRAARPEARTLLWFGPNSRGAHVEISAGVDAEWQVETNAARAGRRRS